MKKATGAFAAFLYTTSAIGATLLPNGQQQFVDATGKPYANGRVYFYSNFPTCSILKNTYQNEAGTINNPNPVQLDASGRATIFGTGSYCQVLKDANGTTIWTKYTSDTSSASNLGWGGTGGGTANLQTVSVNGFNQLNGQTFYYIPIATNTGPATIKVNNFGAAAIVKQTYAGIENLTGGELVVNAVVGLTYVQATGQFQLITNNNIGYVGEIRAFAFAGCPAGWFAADGASKNATAYAALAAVLGTTWGTSAGNVVLPNLQNQFLRGSGTSAVGVAETNQNKLHTHTATSVVTDPGHTHSYTYSTVAGGAAISSSSPTPFGNTNVGGTTSSYTPTPPGITVATTNVADGGSEVRPDNKRVQFCVKY